MGKEAILKLLDSVDSWIPTPARDLDKPFLLPIEEVFSILGRGTVTTGRVERGVMKKGDEAEIVGLGSKLKTTITGMLYSVWYAHLASYNMHAQQFLGAMQI